MTLGRQDATRTAEKRRGPLWDYLEIVPDAPPTAVIVLLHGAFSGMNESARLARLIGGSRVFICPNGAHAVGESWSWLPPAAVRTAADFEVVESQLDAFITAISASYAGLPVVLGGFSQGGNLSLRYGLMSRRRRLEGLFCLSHLLAPELAAGLPVADDDAPEVFLAAGLEDAEVAASRIAETAVSLRVLGYDLTHREYRMGHTICAAEVRDLRQWLNELVANRSSADSY